MKGYKTVKMSALKQGDTFRYMNSAPDDLCNVRLVENGTVFYTRHKGDTEGNYKTDGVFVYLLKE